MHGHTALSNHPMLCVVHRRIAAKQQPHTALLICTVDVWTSRAGSAAGLASLVAVKRLGMIIKNRCDLMRRKLLMANGYKHTSAVYTMHKAA